MLKWADFSRILQTRAIEETDTEGRVWSKDSLRQATKEAFSTGGAQTDRFLKARASLLEGRRQNSGNPTRFFALPELPAWLATTGWVLAFGAGWLLAALGQEREINLLALPLIGVLAWNVVVMVWSFLSGWGNKPVSENSLVFQILKRWTSKQNAQEPTAQRLLQLGSGVWAKRVGYRFRAWLHIAAALLAIGSAAGMYARGWSKEYRAVWESTLLDERGASTFFSTLFTPASKALNLPVPVADLAGMRRGGDHDASRPAPALPWIHLYAATLGLLIVAPRVLLSFLEIGRAARVPDREIRGAGWSGYIEKLMSQVDGKGIPVQILVHGLDVTEEAKDRWRSFARQHWAETGSFQFTAIPVGDEILFADKWEAPAGQRLMLVFNLASVPEIEIHRWLAVAIQDKVKASRSSVGYFIVTDDYAVRKRWSGYADYAERLAGRQASWRNVLQNLPLNEEVAASVTRVG